MTITTSVETNPITTPSMSELSRGVAVGFGRRNNLLGILVVVSFVNHDKFCGCCTGLCGVDVTCSGSVVVNRADADVVLVNGFVDVCTVTGCIDVVSKGIDSVVDTVSVCSVVVGNGCVVVSI